MTISIIVAVSENFVIGSNNQLPWHLSADLKRVKQLTMGHHLIMGRKTFESIGKPLPGRTTVIITRDKNYFHDGCITASSLHDAMEKCKGDEEVFIFGGGEIFKEGILIASKIYLTKIHHHIEGDTFFPKPDPKEWSITQHEDFKPDEKNKYAYSFITMQRKNPS